MFRFAVPSGLHGFTLPARWENHKGKRARADETCTGSLEEANLERRLKAQIEASGVETPEAKKRLIAGFPRLRSGQVKPRPSTVGQPSRRLCGSCSSSWRCGDQDLRREWARRCQDSSPGIRRGGLCPYGRRAGAAFNGKADSVSGAEAPLVSCGRCRG